MREADAIEAEAAKKRILDEPGLWQTHLIVFVPVAANLEDLARLLVDGDLVRKRQPGRLAVDLMLESGDVELAIGFEHLAVAVVALEEVVLADAGDLFGLQFLRRLDREAGVAEMDVAIGA